MAKKDLKGSKSPADADSAYFDTNKFAIWLHENLQFMYTKGGAKFNLPTWTAEKKAE